VGVGNQTLLAHLPVMMELEPQKLYGYQHNDSGWGWWYDDSSNEYQTAYVQFRLAETRDAVKVGDIVGQACRDFLLRNRVVPQIA
jgi:hypothetical protein